MGRKYKKVWKTILYILFACFLASGGKSLTVQSAPEEVQAVHIEPSEIETSTLAIGTHLIYLGAMNDMIYELAQETAQNFNQSEIYYKSELGEDGWYSIGGADSVQVILPEGNRIDEEKIGALFFTHHTRSDGVTYDLRTNEPVCLFDINNPYDRNELSELEELRDQKTLLRKGGMDIGFLEDFFEEGKNSEIQVRQMWGRQIQTLHSVYLAAAGNGETERQTILLELMEQADAVRRLDFNRETLESLNVLLDTVTGSETLSGNADLIQAIGVCIGNLQTSMDARESKASSLGGSVPSEGGSVLAQVEKELTEELLNAAETENDALWGLLDERAALSHIENGICVDKRAEKTVLDNRLLPMGETLYESTGDEVILQELNYYQTLREQIEGRDQKEMSDGDRETGTEQNEPDGVWIKAFLEKELKSGFGNADSRAQNTVLLALAKYCEVSDEDTSSENTSKTPDQEEAQTAAELLWELAAEASEDEEGGVFPQGGRELSGQTQGSGGMETILYAPVRKAAMWCSMRYVWKQEHRQAVLAKRGRYYRFEAFSDQVVRERKQTDQMESIATYDSELYLPGSYLQKEFGVNIRLLGETGYALFAEKEVETEAEELSEKLLERRGG